MDVSLVEVRGFQVVQDLSGKESVAALIQARYYVLPLSKRQLGAGPEEPGGGCGGLSRRWEGRGHPDRGERREGLFSLRGDRGCDKDG